MLQLRNISFSIAGRPLFQNATANIPKGHKVGLVGRNGTGKSTLFRLIKGELDPDEGDILVSQHVRIGGVEQEAPGNEASLVDTVLSSDSEREALLSENSEDPGRIAEIQSRLSDISAWSAEARAASILKGLGFDDKEQAMPCSAFSGGWRMRVSLAAALFSRPDLLLLDEPTNYLDLEGALWLEYHIMRYPGTAVIISHDRGLLNRSVGAILHLEDRNLKLYSGGYDKFAEARLIHLASTEAEAKRQAARKAHLQSYIDRFRYKADKARQAQSRLKALAKMKPVLGPREVALRKFGFPEPEEISPPIIRIENADAGYDGKVVLKGLNLRVDQDDRIALLGKNGEGKSTLAKLLAGIIKPIKGTVYRSGKLRIGYFAQHQVDDLRLDETPMDHARRILGNEPPVRLRNRLGGFGLGENVAEISVGNLSGGQKTRLSLMLATSNAPHMLILDEPGNHLDIESREALTEALTGYGGAIILVSHDMHFLDLVSDRLWRVQNGDVSSYDGDLESYRLTLLGRSTPDKGKASPKVCGGKASRDEILLLRQDVRTCEQRIEKLNDMREHISARLASPDMYKDENLRDMEKWRRKYTEVVEGIGRAESLWISAQERLEKAGG